MKKKTYNICLKLANQKFLSSLALAIPFYYIIYTGKELNKDEESFLILNLLASFGSMYHRQYDTLFTRSIDQIMICSLLINYHIFSSFILSIISSCFFYNYIFYIYPICAVWFMCSKYFFLKFFTIFIGLYFFKKNKDNDTNFTRWCWHITQGLYMLYPFLFNELKTKVKLIY